MGPTDADNAAEADYDSHRAAYEQGKRDGRAEALRELLPALRDLLDDVSSPHHVRLYLARLPDDARTMLADAERGGE